jgi:hypothetical protein
MFLSLPQALGTISEDIAFEGNMQLYRGNGLYSLFEVKVIWAKHPYSPIRYVLNPFYGSGAIKNTNERISQEARSE